MAAQVAQHDGGHAADAELDRGAVRDQAGDMLRDRVLDITGRFGGYSAGDREVRTSTSIWPRLSLRSQPTSGTWSLTSAITVPARPISVAR